MCIRDRLIDQNPPVIERFAQPTPPAVLDELLEKLPDFRKSYCLHAIEPSEYEAFGPVVLFLSLIHILQLQIAASKRVKIKRSKVSL